MNKMNLLHLNKKLIIGLFYTVVFFIINYTASLSSVRINTYFSIIIIIMAIMFNVFITKKANIKALIKINLNSILIILIMLLGGISLLINYEFDIYSKFKLIHFILLFSIIPLFAASIIKIKDYMKIILYSLITSGVLVIPFIFNNININQFNNSGIGLLAIGIALIIAYLDSRSNIITRILSMIGLLVVILAIAYVNSRTSLITFIVIIFTSVFITKTNNRKKRFGNLLRNLLMIVFLIFILLSVFEEKLFPILNKFNHSINAGSLLSSRNLIWKYTLERINLFGHGKQLYSNMGFEHAHNTYIGILGVFGVLVFVLFVIYSIVSLLNSFKYYKYNYAKGVVCLFPLLINITFIIVSLTEDIINHPKMLLITVLFFLFNQVLNLEANYKRGVP